MYVADPRSQPDGSVATDDQAPLAACEGANVARVYDALLSGKENYAADRAAADGWKPPCPAPPAPPRTTAPRPPPRHGDTRLDAPRPRAPHPPARALGRPPAGRSPDGLAGAA